MKTLIIIALAVVLLAACSKAISASSSEGQASGSQAAITFVDARGAAQMIAERDDLTVIDVRTPREFESGHIEGAINIDFKARDFAEQLSRIDPDKAYLIHCRSGGRSKASLRSFKALNFTNITHMDGGTIGWNAARLPLTQ
ncbi:MAG: rhodanese-like domain-containing protein [Robiginitomaculum sp.]